MAGKGSRVSKASRREPWYPPDEWDDGDREGLLKAVESGAQALVNRIPPPAWNKAGENLGRVVRAWSQAVVRLIRANCTLMRADDILTPIANSRELMLRAADLRLLAARTDRVGAANRAFLLQLLIHEARGKEPAWNKVMDMPALKRAVKTISVFVDADVIRRWKAQLAETGWQTFPHWSDIRSPSERIKQAKLHDEQRLYTLLGIKLHGSMDIVEMKRRPLGGNVVDWLPEITPTPANKGTILLENWVSLNGADDAVKRIFK